MKIFISLLFVSLYRLNAAGLECQTLPFLFQVYLEHHYLVRELSPDLQKKTVEQMIKQLDPSKTVLLKADVEMLRSTLPSLFISSGTGNCAILGEMHNLLIRRIKEVEAFVKVTLSEAYAVDETATLNLNPDKRDYPASTTERNEFLKKMVHFQITNYLLGDMAMPEARKQLNHRYELITKRVTERTPTDLLNLFAGAFALGLDPHSSFMSKDNLEDFQIQMGLSLEGIGAQLSSQDGYTVVEELIPGGGADRTGKLRPKDKIIAVAQGEEKAVQVIDMDLSDVVRMIRGKKGTKVRLTILRQGKTTERFEISIIRDKVDMKDQAAKISYETRTRNGQTKKIAILDLPSFYGDQKGQRSCYRDVRNLLSEAAAKKPDGLVLNLSRNGGGLLEDAVKLSGLFIRKGGIVATQNTDRKIQVLDDEDPRIQFSGPMVVLISRRSASASEILAGALKDYGRAVIVGDEHTFGKGTVQVFSPISAEVGGITVTTGMFFRPSGISTQHVGVASDLRLPSIWNTDDFGEKALDYSLPAQTITTFLSNEANSEGEDRWQPLNKDLLSQLSTKSQARIAVSTKFQEILKDLAESKANDGLVKIVDLKKKSDDKQKKDEEHKTQAQLMAEYDAPYLEESMQILLDLIQATNP